MRCCSQGTAPSAPEVVFSNLACTERFGLPLHSTAFNPEASKGGQQASYLSWIQWNLQVSRVRTITDAFLYALTHMHGLPLLPGTPGTC